MIQSPSKEITLIVYNQPKAPKYFKVDKRLIRSLVVIIPILVISSISISFLYSTFLKKEVNDLKAKEPRILAKLNKDKEELQDKLNALTNTNNILEKKLSLGSTIETSISSLGLFTTPLGIEDLRDKELLNIDNIKLKTEKGKIKFSFDLANNSEIGEKLSGYLTVVQYQKNQIQFYPSYELDEKNLRLIYSNGERFSFSRFRPTLTEFNKTQNTSVRYKIYIFSRNGNLIAYKQAGPFNIE